MPSTFQIQTAIGIAFVKIGERGIVETRLKPFTKGSATGPTRRRNKKSELFELEKKLQEYPKGIKQSLLKALNNLLQLGWNEDVPLMLDGTPFQIQVWKLLLTVPRGETWTYQELANHLGRPSATRAVANACGANKIAYFIPCHRIIRSDGGLGGYRWGIELKRRLLDVEKSQLELGFT